MKRSSLIALAAAAALLLSPASARGAGLPVARRDRAGQIDRNQGRERRRPRRTLRQQRSRSAAEKRATRDNPESVRIDVVPHAGGVTICAVYPSRSGARPNECAPGNAGRMQRAEQRRHGALHRARAGRRHADRQDRQRRGRSQPAERRRRRSPPSTGRSTSRRPAAAARRRSTARSAARWDAPTGPTRSR